MAQYIQKDAVMSVIDKKLSYYKDLESRGLLSKEGDAAFRAVRILKSDINFLEVKEVDLDFTKEPVSEDLEEEFKRAANNLREQPTLHDWFRYFYNLGKQHREPVSEDFKEQLDKYLKDNFTIDKEPFDRFGIEEKDYMYSMDKGDILKIISHFVNWQKQQMMKDAVETNVDFSMAHKLGAKEGSRVKLIIIKE